MASHRAPHREPQLTARLQGFGTTIFTEMSALAHRHRAVNLGQGFPDFPPDPRLAAAARQAIADGHNQYAPGAGIGTLRRAVAGHATASYGLGYDPDHEVTVTTGATEAVFATLQALLDVGDEVVLLEPVYDVYPAAVAMAGGVARTVQLRPGADGRWVLDPDDLAAVVGPRTRAILLNSPHNPTGTVMARAELEAVADIAIAHDLVVITDEVYEHLVYGGGPDGPAHVPIATLPGMHQRTVRISSAGKTFSVTGWKVGWACAPADLTAAIQAAKQWITFTSGTPFQHAVAQALTWGGAYTGPLAAQYAARRDQLCDGLAELGFGVQRPDGSYFATADIGPLGFSGAPGADGMAFCRALPGAAGVAAIPVQAFHRDPRASPTAVRFAFCKTEGMIDQGLSRLADRLPHVPRTTHPPR